jgi:phospholipid/cholesterol/gamma-HCH transport system permease protein
MRVVTRACEALSQERGRRHYPANEVRDRSVAPTDIAGTDSAAGGAFPLLSPSARPGGRMLVLSGDWIMAHAGRAESAFESVTFTRGESVTLEMHGVRRLDTLGALLVAKLKNAGEAAGAAVELSGDTPEHRLLLAEVQAKPDVTVKHNSVTVIDLLEDIGRGMGGFGRDIVGGVSFFGGFIAALGRVIANPRRFRGPAFVRQLESVGFRSVPIIALISFLVGGIIAQQSVFQLRTFGTTAFVADLLGVLVLRELGVLLTAIMIAGRSGSAITAEIGSMKMREEIDALRTMGLDPMEVLIVPRILALIVAMPILTFVGSMSGLLGGGLVAWVYGDVSPDVFLSRLQGAVRMNTFMVGMIKAPVMALVIGLIAAIEGAAVKGSAESLGQQTTASVVKAIFMVIVVDGLFAMFFAAIQY